MDDAGADILKIAVMPEKQEDVLTLLAATYEETKRTTHPVITMAMSGMGAVSRISGGDFWFQRNLCFGGRMLSPGAASPSVI